MSSNIRISIAKNDVLDTQFKKINVDTDRESFEAFLQKCSNKLAINAQLVFAEDGDQITELDVLREGDKLYIS
jgi:hypothetical protein